MHTAQIVTPFAGTGAEEDPYRPRLAVDHAIAAWTDVTATPAASIPPGPNLYAVEAKCSAEVLDDVDADDTYLVLWAIDDQGGARAGQAGRGPADVPDPAAFGQLRAYLARHRPAGIPPPEWAARIAAVTGEPGAHTRGQIAAALRAWLATFPRAA